MPEASNSNFWVAEKGFYIVQMSTFWSYIPRDKFRVREFCHQGSYLFAEGMK